jgi:hypothetical protein
MDENEVDLEATRVVVEGAVLMLEVRSVDAKDVLEVKRAEEVLLDAIAMVVVEWVRLEDFAVDLN